MRRRFRRLSAIVLAALVVAVGGLAAANAVQGPRLRSAEVNTAWVIDRSGQRLVLHANQQLSDVAAEQLSIEPATAATISTDGATVTVRFEQLLDYATEYTVTIEARGRFTGSTGSLQHRFTTPEPEVFALQREARVDQRGQKRPDRIVRGALSGGSDDEVVFEASRIQEYALLGELMVVAALDERDEPRLVLTTPGDTQQAGVPLPPGSTLSQLRSSRTAALYGYLLHTPGDPGAGARLLVHDPNGSESAPFELLGLDGAPLPIVDWLFVPGSSAVVAQAEDLQLYLVDPLADAPPSPLGQHSELRGFLPGTVSLVVADPLSIATIDLGTGTVTPLQLPEPDADPELHPDTLLPLDADRYIQLNHEVDYRSMQVRSLLLVPDRSSTRQLLPTSDTARIVDFCLSPNGQYAAVELSANDGEPDGYPMLPGQGSTSTYFVAVDDGRVIRGITGFLPDWCR